MVLDIRLVAVLCLFSAFATSYGGYVIMIPKRWQLGGQTQMCVVVDDPTAPSGQVTVTASAVKYIRRRVDKPPPPPPPPPPYPGAGSYQPSPRPRPQYETEEQIVHYLPPTVVQIPPGNVQFCQDLALREEELLYRNTQVTIQGNVAGSFVNITTNVRYGRNDFNTIIQTDKYLYKPGQLVQFRMLTHFGPLMNISKESYPEIWVTSPSRTRIAQWKDVDNSACLVHLKMQLIDEPEEGTYRIHVRTSDDKKESFTTSFKVEEYVLPRFEVNIELPKYVAARDSSFTFKVCANYTFGQPVNGNLLVKISNNAYRGCRVVITKNQTMSGCQEFTVLSSEIKTIDCSVSSLSINAKVTERGTGVKAKASGRLHISRTLVSFKTLYNDKYLKYNLPYTLKVRAELPDGSPADKLPVELCYDGSCRNITTEADGLINVYVTKFDSRRVVMKSLNARADMYETSFTSDIERYFSPSNSSLMIYAPEGKAECVPGETTFYNLKVLFSTPDLTSANINVQVISRDKIQYWESDTYQLTPSELPYGEEVHIPSQGSGTTGLITIRLKLPHTAAPNAWVLVWYIREDGEVVSDAAELEMEKCLPIDVHFDWIENDRRPGDTAFLYITSEPGSLCSLGVVDKSVELLNPNTNVLTTDTFFNGISQYSSWWGHRSQIDDYSYCRDQNEAEDNFGHSYYTDYVDALKMFDESGLFTFSDLQLETRPCEKYESLSFTPYRSYASKGGGGGGYMGPSGADSGMRMSSPVSDRVAHSEMTTVEMSVSNDGDATSSNPRTDFPETWLWELLVIPPYGEADKEVRLPDTVTEWVGNAVCVHPEKGVGVSKKASITTFAPFFLDLTLPPSIKRGEILPVKISVFNYVAYLLPVTVVLEESSEYEIIEGTNTIAHLCMNSNEMEVYTVKIKPSAVGDVNITVSASVDYSYIDRCHVIVMHPILSDSLIKSVLVEAEGFPKEKTWTKFICSDEVGNGDDSLESWEVSAPSGIVEGSDRGWVMVVGDLLALSIENLGHLTQLPSGCGEQNMLNFAPNIYILQYLEASNQDAPEAKEKLLNYMNTGYKRQLLYLRRDGSFSAFGNADDSGSTWLTAFVLKSLSQAQDYILIDQRTINSSMEWLQRSQNEDGCYQSKGTVFNKAMRGGVSVNGSSVSLTAYVMISLLESGLTPTHPSLMSAISCLQSHSTLNLYVIALRAYAFALAKHSETSQLLEQLLSLATETKNAMHWELPLSSWGSPSLEVETAGYAVLAMMTSEPETYEVQATKIIKWLTTRRNAWGGFVSTQDTVVALQAMAAFESHLNRGNLNAIVTARTADLLHSFKVTEDNKLLQQQVTIPSIPSTLSLDISGEGCTLMQAVLRYNVPEPEGSHVFSLTVNTRTAHDQNCITKRITTCVSYLLPDGKTNMAVVEVYLVSGYIPDKSDLKKMLRGNRSIKRYEIDGNKLSFYIEEFTSESLCLNFRITREIDIENIKPGSVVVYDYYQPEYTISKLYTLPDPDDCLYSW